jgi:hypothetical protein
MPRLLADAPAAGFCAAGFPVDWALELSVLWDVLDWEGLSDEL